MNQGKKLANTFFATFRMRISPTPILLFLFACQPSERNSHLSETSIDTIKVKNGFSIRFYSNDVTEIDSIHTYHHLLDTTLLTQVWVENSLNEIPLISFKITTDSITIRHNKPVYEYLAIQSLSSDTVIWGPPYHNDQISIHIRNSYLLGDYYLLNWGIIPMSDSIGGYGIQLNRYIRMKGYRRE